MRIVTATVFTFVGVVSWCSQPVEAGDFLGWHQVSRYGTFDARYEDVWEDLNEDVYGAGKLNDLYADPHNLFDLGQGFWACPGCQYVPPDYEVLRQSVTNHTAPYAGSSWYRGLPRGMRTARPLSRETGAENRSERVP